MEQKIKKNYKISITGGPCSGKTDLINLLIKKGFYCFEEISREIIRLGRSKGIKNYFSERPLDFSEVLVIKRKEQYMLASNLLMKNDAPFVFFDRGLHDIFAYLDHVRVSSTNLNIDLKEYQYDLAFILPPWKDIYKTDGERKETYEESVLIYNCIKNTYKKYRIPLVEIQPDNVENRVLKILDHIKSNPFSLL